MLFICRKNYNVENKYVRMLREDKQKKIFKEKIIRGNDVYAINENNLIIYNKEQDIYKTFSLEYKVNGLDVNGNNIYYIYTEHKGKNISYIVKNSHNYRKEDEEKVKVDHIVLTCVSVYGNDLYVFGFDYDKNGIFSKMYVYDSNNLRLKKEMDFSDYIIDVTGTCMNSDKIYISGRTARKKEGNEYIETNNKYICEIDVKEYFVRKIYIGDISYEVFVKDSSIYVSNYDEVYDEGNIIYEISFKSGLRKKYDMSEKATDIYSCYEKLKKRKNNKD